MPTIYHARKDVHLDTSVALNLPVVLVTSHMLFLTAANDIDVADADAADDSIVVVAVLGAAVLSSGGRCCCC